MITSAKISLDTWLLTQDNITVGSVVMSGKPDNRTYSASKLHRDGRDRLGKFTSLYAAKKAIKHAVLEEV